MVNHVAAIVGGLASQRWQKAVAVFGHIVGKFHVQNGGNGSCDVCQAHEFFATRSGLNDTGPRYEERNAMTAVPNVRLRTTKIAAGVVPFRLKLDQF